MTPGIKTAARYRFGIFEADASAGELRRKGIRVKLNAQPFQVLLLLLERPGDLLSREEIASALWPDGTFVDFDHGLNSAINRIREALGDTASNPRFVETLARRGYRFIAPVERLDMSPLLPAAQAPLAEEASPRATSILATPEDLPHVPHRVSKTLFLLLQIMYLGFYIGALANLAEINELLSALPYATALFDLLIVTAAILIPVRSFQFCAVVFKAPRARHQILRIWPALLLCDVLWSLAPFLLLHHIPFGLAIACTAILVYSPFAQRSLILMGAADTLPNS
ncbi:MAG: winged helix-turn-helix domain-containing protein [Acidobacteriota bacterium]|nr:winged helix-turn-helix domain-containing protein [Acidobacteriota bacterium]